MRRRIHDDTGGDRRGRGDDVEDAIRERFRRFETETLPLVELFRARGLSILEVDVGPETRAEALIPCLEHP